jgi:hypothetical protein
LRHWQRGGRSRIETVTVVMRLRATTISHSGASAPAVPSACSLSVPVGCRRIALPFRMGASLVEILCRRGGQGDTVSV